MCCQTIRLIAYGRVQGVGFRPSVCRLAKEHDLQGLVRNLGNGVEIIARGMSENLQAFKAALQQLERPAFIEKVLEEKVTEAELVSLNLGEDFQVAESSNNIAEATFFPADLAICPECEKELLTLGNHRYHYPYISCAACGPRYTIIRELPYDRQNTTMDKYPLCSVCAAEYQDMQNRRGRGETIGCHDCGPQLVGYVKGGEQGLTSEAAVVQTKELLQQGKIILVKSLGGFNLVCRADEEDAVAKLRQLKHRPTKPFAVMVANLESAQKLCVVSVKEAELLQSGVRPIVLLQKREDLVGLSQNVSFGTPYLGVFLPPMGLYSLLLADGVPLIVTSANYSGQPILIDDKMAEKFYSQHADIAGLFTYDREILRLGDDSVMQVAWNTPVILRRTRGFLPEPIILPCSPSSFAPESSILAPRSSNLAPRSSILAPCSSILAPRSSILAPQTSPLPPLHSTLYALHSVLSVGAQMEPGFCLAKEDKFYLAQVPGHAEEYATAEEWWTREKDWERFLHFEPKLVVGDLHPNYDSTRWGRTLAKQRGLRFLQMQHHFAHALSVIAEHNLQGKVLAVTFDGTGYGEDGSIWGGEFLLCEGLQYQRVAHLESTTFIGGDDSMQQAWKTALCYLSATGLDLPNDERSKLVQSALKNKVNTIPNSSIGRLFDAVAYLLGVGEVNSHQGCCAQRVEEAAVYALQHKIEPLELHFDKVDNVYSPKTLIKKIVTVDKKDIAQVAAAALGFHYAIAEMVLAVARQIRQQGVEQIALTGGCFVNRVLLEKCCADLQQEHFKVYFNQQVSPGDGGVLLGQAYYGQLWQEEN